MGGLRNSFVFDLQPQLSTGKNAWKETATLAHVNMVIKKYMLLLSFCRIAQINKSGPWAWTPSSEGEKAEKTTWQTEAPSLYARTRDAQEGVHRKQYFLSCKLYACIILLSQHCSWVSLFSVAYEEMSEARELFKEVYPAHNSRSWKSELLSLLMVLLLSPSVVWDIT